VCCDKPGIRPALGKNVGLLGKDKGSWWKDDAQTEPRYQTPAQRWEHVMKDTGEWDAARRQMRWVHDDEAACCYAIPTAKWSDEPAQGGGPIKRLLFDLFVVGKIPESLSVLVTFVVTGAMLFLVVLLISAEIVAVLEDENFQEAKRDAIIELNKFLKTEYKLAVSELLAANETVEDEVQIYEQDDLSTLAEPWLLVVNDLVTTLLLCLYMLSTREPEDEETVYKEVQRMSLFEKIRDKIKHYVILKTALSALTGGVVGIILFVTKVRLAMLFGLLTFMLNFIPNIGSLIAMVLPIPIILLDKVDGDYPGRVPMALLLPVLVQGYVGNVLEPVLFGKSLNVTAISVLVALVLWGSIWGIQGAVLSVPLLAALKVALEEADHPMCKMILRVVRESASIDDAVEAQKGRRVRKMQKKMEREAIKANTPMKGQSSWNLNADADRTKTTNPLQDISETDAELGESE
jgi:AI-2 transport protein TqsA